MVHNRHHGTPSWTLEIGAYLATFSIIVLALWITRRLEKYYKKRQRRLKNNRKQEEAK
jgi:hypothetical protein